MHGCVRACVHVCVRMTDTKKESEREGECVCLCTYAIHLWSTFMQVLVLDVFIMVISETQIVENICEV